MGLIEILWTVTGIVVPLLLGTAWAMMGLSPPEFWIARGCVGVAAILFIGTAIVWLVLMEWPAGARILVAAVLGAASLVVSSESFRLINAREKALVEQAAKGNDQRRAVREKLQQFYIASGPLLNRNIPKDVSQEEFNKYVEEVNVWILGTAAWIKENLGDAAEARFGDIGGGFSFSWNRAANEQHNTIINVLTKYRENLAKLIETSAWDEAKSKN
jgi:hypothetical protein